MAGSWIILSCVCPIFFSVSGLVFAIAVASILGGGMTNAVLALAVISWPKYARLARSQALTVRRSHISRRHVCAAAATRTSVSGISSLLF
ncbi:MAG: hypothetical protein ACLRXQ_07165 [Phascolarctobacterium faecium]